MMLFNKNNVRKVNDKKVLHKVGKNWKVVSLALLLAIGGTAAATHVNANADANNPYAGIAGSEYYQNNTPTPQPVHHNAKANTNNNVINFKTGYAGSAAKNNSLANSASDAIANNASVVNSYVGSINSNFSGSVTSYKNAINSGSNASSGDNSLANSYSAVANNDNTKNLISNLASKASFNPTDFVNSVANAMSGFSDAAKGAKANSSMVNLASSLVNKITNITPAQANEGSALTSANVAVDNAKNTDAYDQYSDMSNVVNAESAAMSNDSKNINNANTQSISDATSANVANIYLNNDGNKINAIASYLVSGTNSASNVGAVKNFLSSFASSAASGVTNYANVHAFNNTSSMLSNGITLDPASSGNPETRASESASLDVDAYNIVSNEVQSEVAKSATSLDNKSLASYNKYLASDTASFDANNKKLASYESASTSASNALDVANAQSVIANVVSSGIGINSASAFSYAESLLSNGVANDFNSLSNAAGSSVATSYGSKINAPTAFYDALEDKFSNNEKAIITDLLHDGTDVMISAPNNENDVANMLNNAANLLNSISFSNHNSSVNSEFSSNTISGNHYEDVVNALNGASDPTKVGNILKYGPSDALMKLAVNGLGNGNTITALNGTYGPHVANVDQLNAGIHNIQTALHDAASEATKVAGSINNSNGLSSATDQNATKSALATALTKDGLNINSLSASSDSNAIDSVASDFQNESASVSGSSDFSGDDSSAQVSATFSLLANSAVNNSSAASSAASSYAVANDVNSVLASSYANSYSNAAKSEGNVAKTASNGLNQLYSDKADSPVFNDAFNAYKANEGKVNNYRNLAYANGMHVFNYGPKYINVIKKCAIHTNANYGENGDHKLINVPAGAQRLPVIGVGITYDGSFVYKTIYRGYKGFITNLKEYVKPAYLFKNNNVNVLVTRSNTAYSTPNFAKGSYVGAVKSGNVIHNADVISMDNVRGGFTRLAFNYKGNTYYTTTNTDYVQLAGNANNPKPNNNSHHSHVNPDNGPVDFL